MIYIETGSTDVYYNFGLEYYFAAEKKLPEPVLLFWRTTPTLMVGKYQNILEEINKPYADAHKIRLVRRMSGGGTIYTDLGGWQFTFIEHSDQTQIDFSQYIGPVVDAVRELGADAGFNGRNDLLIGGRKFSGNAQNPLPYEQDEAATPPERKRTEAKTNSAIEIYREIIKDNIDYDILIQDPKMDKDRLDEIVEIMLETVCTARKTIRIAGDDYPAELVKSKFMKLNSSHVEFVLDCMRENTTKIRNIKQYLKAVLFNAPSTIDSYYTALVNHDFYGSK